MRNLQPSTSGGTPARVGLDVLGPRTGWLDAQMLSERELALVEAGTVRERLQPVWLRRGRWFPVTLTGWCLLEPGAWAVRVQTGADAAPVWVRHRPASLQVIEPLDGLPPQLDALSRSLR